MQQRGSSDFLCIWHFLIPSLHVDPAGGHLFLTRSTLNEAGAELLEVVARGDPECQRWSANTPWKDWGGDRVTLWTPETRPGRRGVVAGVSIGSFFLYPRCISIPVVPFEISAVYRVCGDWGVEEEALNHLMDFCNLYKKGDTSAAVRHEHDVCFSHLHSRIDPFLFFPYL